jgi:hypothetical protein
MRAPGARRPHCAPALAALAALGCATNAPAPAVDTGRPPPSPALSADAARGAEPLAAEPVAATPPPPEAPPEAKPPPVRRPGAYANLDPDDDFIVGPPDAIEDCDAQLKAAGVTFRHATLPTHVPKRSKVVCGSPQVVTYVKGPGGIAYNSPPLLTCGMALALASFERITQQEAKRIFRSQVAYVDHLGTYACRVIAAYPDWVSEHSYANAIDIARFVLKNGKTIDVLHDFDVRAGEPTRPAGAFLRAVSRRANDEDVFSHVLTPFFDAGHRNHFHVDLARFRSDGTRPAVAPGDDVVR